MNAREVAALVLMSRLLAALGFTVNERTRRCPCVIHSGSNLTAFSWSEEGLWHCHSCGAGGDRIDLVRAVRQCSFGEAVEFFATLAGVRVADGEFSAERRCVQAKCEADQVAARFLLNAENNALREARQNLWALNRLQRKVSRRLGELENGKPERRPEEIDWAWDALQFVHGAIARADTAYCIAAFSAPVERAAFALNPEQCEAMIQAALERGIVADSRGFRFEVNL